MDVVVRETAEIFWLLALLVRTAAHLRMGLQEGSGYSAEPVGMRHAATIRRLLWDGCMRLN